MAVTSPPLTLNSENFPASSVEENGALDSGLKAILQADYKGNLHVMLAAYQRIMADNRAREQWPHVHDKLSTLFKCGRAVPLDGPMIGMPVSIRDSDHYRDTANLSDKDRSLLASIELLAAVWNDTFSGAGQWMGKTFEPVSEQIVRNKCGNDPETMIAYDPETTRIGRNFFRQPRDPNLIQGLGLPVLEEVWHLQDRPMSTDAEGFEGELLKANLVKEMAIPYSKTGGFFLAGMAVSVVPEMHGKQVYQLNYRWPGLEPVYPMSRLIDEVVQIGEGVYLGQLVFATKHYSLGNIDTPFAPDEFGIELGEPYEPHKHTIFESIRRLLTGHSKNGAPDYGYQHNGFFLLLDPAYARKVYADNAFPQLRPRPGEIGYKELGYAVVSAVGKGTKSRLKVGAMMEP